MKKLFRVEHRQGKTRTFNAETGEPIPARAVKFEHEVNGIPLLTIVIPGCCFDVEIEAEADPIIEPIESEIPYEARNEAWNVDK